MYLKRLILFLITLLIVQACSSTREYTVRPGDSLSKIAKQHNMSVKELQQLNNISNPNLIKAGQTLVVKGKAGEVPVASTAASSNANPQPLPKRNNTVVTPAASPAPKDKVTTPVKNWRKPTAGNVVRTYNPNIPGQKGIQIAGTLHQPIVAANDGEIVFAGAGNSGYGQLIIIRHNANTYSAYGYLSSINVKEGRKVKKGEQIGTMGNSFDGRTVLYFEIRTQGQTVNPMNYI